ncbi:MAG: hypothetical protein SF029_08055 [bacterium]|nr:hypothetical protein [bacterium]
MGFAENMPGRQVGWQGCLISSVVILLGIVVLIVGIYIAIDASCVASAEDWLPDYPGSTFVEQDYSWLRAFGIGETQRILYSSDEVEQVRRWYFERDLAKGNAGASRGGVAALGWAMTAHPDDGTTIILSSVCARELAVGGRGA